MLVQESGTCKKRRRTTNRAHINFDFQDFRDILDKVEVSSTQIEVTSSVANDLDEAADEADNKAFFAEEELMRPDIQISNIVETAAHMKSDDAQHPRHRLGKRLHKESELNKTWARHAAPSKRAHNSETQSCVCAHLFAPLKA